MWHLKIVPCHHFSRGFWRCFNKLLKKGWLHRTPASIGVWGGLFTGHLVLRAVLAGYTVQIRHNKIFRKYYCCWGLIEYIQIRNMLRSVLDRILIWRWNSYWVFLLDSTSQFQFFIWMFQSYKIVDDNVSYLTNGNQCENDWNNFVMCCSQQAHGQENDCEL